MSNEAIPAMRLTAGAPTSVLISSLARSYWGVLDGAEWRAARSVLQALTLVPTTKQSLARFDFKGEIYTTATQLQRIAGYCERWTRIALQTLEEMGVIRWTRGMIVAGQPTPSCLTVIKRKLVDLITFARPRSKRIDEERRDSFLKRLADILTRRRDKSGAVRAPEAVRVPSKGRGGVQTNDLQARSCWSLHAEVNASPSTPVGGYPARRVTLTKKRLFRDTDNDNRKAVDLFSASVNTVETSLALSPATIKSNESQLGEVEMLPPIPPAHLDHLPDACPHGEYSPRQCALCVDATRNKNEMENWRRQVGKDPAYKRVEAAGGFEVSDERIIRDRATQIATEQANSRAFTDRAEWIAYIITTADRLVKEYKAKGEAVLWR